MKKKKAAQIVYEGTVTGVQYYTNMLLDPHGEQLGTCGKTKCAVSFALAGGFGSCEIEFPEGKAPFTGDKFKITLEEQKKQ